MAGEHVFISYITEDSEAIDELQEALEAADFIVWRDKDKLWPGDDWESEIRAAISGGSFVFLACFSSNLAKREKSYQFAELTLAAEEYRQRPPGASWLMTARLDECEIPDISLGNGRTLGGTIHRADLFGKQKVAQTTRLIMAMQRVMGSTPAIAPASITRVAADASRADNQVVEQVRGLLRNPSLVMDYDEYLTDLRRPMIEALTDRDAFPMDVAPGAKLDVGFVRDWVSRVRRYDDLLSSALVPLRLISMYGSAAHEQELSATLQFVANESTQNQGNDIYRGVHEYPGLLLTYVTALGALLKNNFSMLRSVTANVTIKTFQGERIPFIVTTGAQSVINIERATAFGTALAQEDDNGALTDEQLDALIQGRSSMRYTPVSDHLFSVLAPLYRENFGSDGDYADAFDRVEVFLDAISEDARSRTERFYGPHGGYGRYTWRHRHSEQPPEKLLLAEVQQQGAGWTPLLGGLFGGDVERAVKALEAVSTMAEYVRGRYRFA